MTHPAERVAEYTEAGWWTADTFDSLLRARVAQAPDRLALADPANKADLVGTEPRRLTWRELDDEVDLRAAGLLALGLRQGDVLAVQAPNTVELVAVFLAAWRLGIAVTPFPVQYREHEIGSLSALVGARTFVCPRRIGQRAVAADVAAVLPDLAVCPLDELTGDPSTVDPYVRAHPVGPNDLMTICWTSGTESAPKGVPRCAYDWLAIGRATAGAARICPADVLLNPFPMVNMAGLAGVVLPWLLTGAVLVQHHPFDLPTFLGQLVRERISYTVAPPALLSMLLARPEILADLDLSALRLIGSGSAPLPPAMVRGWQERHGIGVINFFGSNEGTALLTDPYDVPDPEQRARFYPRYGVPGFTWTSPVAEQTTLRLVDVVTGDEITEPGVPGELRLAGPTVFAGYVNAEQLADPFDERGLLRTGDVFEIAGAHGEFLRYLDRLHDLVIRGGLNISPAELEGLIGGHPKVAEVAVIGYPDAVLGERVCAVVVTVDDAELDLDELVAYLRERRIATVKLPERLLRVAALPRNPVGKVLKRELRNLV